MTFSRRLFMNLASWGLALACTVWLFWDFQAGPLLAALKRMSPWAVATVGAASLAIYFGFAARLRLLTGGRARYGDTLRATLLCYGLNNMLPARLGEVAKALYLAEKSGIGVADNLRLLFWERFCDLNMLLVLCAVAALWQGQGLVFTPLAVVVVSLWFCLWLIRARPRFVHGTCRLLPWGGARRVFLELAEKMRSPMAPGFFPKLMAGTFGLWLGCLFVMGLGLVWMGGVSLTPGQVLTVFVVATFGMALPSSPGGLGVYEAAVVGGMGLFGVEKEPALAIALVLRLFNYLPVTLAALFILASGGMRLDRLREAIRAREGEVAPPA